MKERNARVTSEARARPRAGDDADTVGVADPGADTAEAEGSPDDVRLEPGAAAEPSTVVSDDTDDTEVVDDTEGADEPEISDEGGGRRDRRRNRRAAAVEADDVEAESPARGSRLAVPLVPVLAGLFVLLLAATAFLWFTRPHPSSVRTADYVQVLEAARSGVVDLTSFDYLTLDDDIAQVKKIAIGDLQKESVDQLNSKRQDLTTQQAIVNTQVVGAAVTRADDSRGTVVLVIESTQQTKASTQPTVVRYRIEVQLQKVSGQWRLSGIAGR
jgi:Mce-associated membrane protein